MDPKQNSAWMAMTPEQQAQMQSPQMQGLQQAFQPPAPPVDPSVWDKISAWWSEQMEPNNSLAKSTTSGLKKMRGKP